MKIEIVPYRPEWARAFEEERRSILDLGIPGIRKIHHIGSTSVNGLEAKPIIDILIDVQSLNDLDHRKPAMESLGYEVMGEYGIPGRRYYRKGDKKRTHHIHAFQQSDSNLDRHLAFRDYLRHHPEVRRAYGNLKRRVASESNHDADRYCDGKDAFIKLHETKALEWAGLPQEF